jgi:hypothetical protein
MTDCPPWVLAAQRSVIINDKSAEPISNDYQNYDMLKIEKEGVYLHSDEDIHLSHNVKNIVTLVSTSINKQPQYGFAPTTCSKCPQPLRPYFVAEYYLNQDGYHGRLDIIKNTERCTRCGSRRRALTRANRQVDRLELVAAVKNRRISFVTLTFPNYIGEDVRKGYDILKKKIRAFRRKYKQNDVVIDGYDYFEHTVHSDFLGWSNPWEFNVHSHGLWIMKFWDIYDFNKQWGHIAHLTELKGNNSRQRALGYARKYCLKQSADNHRNAQGFGSCYGSAYAEIKSQATHLSQLLDAVDVNE